MGRGATELPPLGVAPMRRAHGIILILVLALAVATRLANAPGVFVGGQVLIWDEDSAYHMYRSSLAAERFPKVHTFDSYTNFPTGARLMWPIGFDLALATLIRFVALVTGGHVRPEVVGVLFDPFLGVLSVLAIYMLGRELGGRAAGIAGAAIAAVLPILTGYSMVGRVDHHAIEPALAALPLALLVRAMRTTSIRARNRVGSGLGLVLAASIGVWPGSLAAGVLVAASVALVALWRPQGDETSTFVRLGRRVFGVAAAAVLPVVLIHPWAASGSFAYFAPSLLQPVVFACAWLSFALAGLVVRRWPGRRDALTAVLVSVPVAAAGVAVVLASTMRDTAHAVLGYLGRGDVQISQVLESYPLLSSGWGTAAQQYGIIAFAFPILLSALVFRAVHGTPPGRMVARAVLPWFVVTAAMALEQVRLGSQFAPIWCALWGAAWAHAARAVERRFGQPRMVWLGAVLVGVAMMAPTLRLHRPTQFPPQAELVRTRDALAWLREQAASPGDVRQPEVRPRFGVMSRWEWGNWLITEAHQANIANPFAQAEVHLRGVRDAAAFFLGTDPAEAVRELERLKARYVLVTPVFSDVENVARHLGRRAASLIDVDVSSGSSAHPREAFARTMNSRLLIFDGLELNLGGQTLPPLRRLRLEYESSSEGEEPGWHGSFCKVFELVPGATVEGTADAGQPVDLLLYLVSNRGRHLTYHDRALADARGRFEFLVPYATDEGNGAVRALGFCRIVASGKPADVTVSEADVKGGRTIHVEPRG